MRVLVLVYFIAMSMSELLGPIGSYINECPYGILYALKANMSLNQFGVLPNRYIQVIQPVTCSPFYRKNNGRLI